MPGIPLLIKDKQLLANISTISKPGIGVHISEGKIADPSGLIVSTTLKHNISAG